MEIRSYFSNVSKCSVVFSCSNSEDGNESEIDVQPYSPKKHCSSSTSKPTSKLRSGIRRCNRKWEETFPWLEFDENLQVHLQIIQKGWKISLGDWSGLDYQTIH